MQKSFHSLTILSRNECRVYREILSRDRHHRSGYESLGPFGDFARKQRNRSCPCCLFGAFGASEFAGTEKPTCFQVAHFFLEGLRSRAETDSHGVSMVLFWSFEAFWEARTRSQRQTFISRRPICSLWRLGWFEQNNRNMDTIWDHSEGGPT